MEKTYDEYAAWAKTLSDTELSHVLYEMRRRGWAVTAYEANDGSELFDVINEPEDGTWFDNEAIEDAMCEAARDCMRQALDEAGAFDETSEDEEI
jgi:hypothetical protein